MAWIDVRVIKDDFTEDSLGRAKATRIYYAQSDVFVTADVALTASLGGVSIPSRTDVYSASRDRAKVTDRNAKRLSPKQFEITVNYADPTDGSVVIGLLGQPARITSGGDSTMEEYIVDYDDPPKYVRNFAGEPFDQAPQRKNKTRVYTIKKYVDAATKAAIRAAENTNNDSPRTIDGELHDTDTLLLSDAQFDPIQSGVWEATFNVEYRRGKWKDPTLNVGFTELVSGKRRTITETINAGTADEQEIPVAKPWPLYPDGSKIPASFASAPIVIDFWPYPQDPWTGVPLS